MLTAVLRPVASGVTMTGICKSDDPDKIQASAFAEFVVLTHLMC